IGDGVDPDSIPDDFKQSTVAGSPMQIAEQIKEKVLDAGIDGVIVYVPTHVIGYHHGHLTALGEALKPLVAG
ncbi:LLM class F420-dependent oxidoreductase, partial [Mycobacterium sp. ITM-2017-0098]